MQVWTEKQIKAVPEGGTVTIGNFDGLHLGHQELLKRAQGFAGPKIVITFDPHPIQVLFPERGLKRIFPREDLVEQLPRFGVDILLILKFDRTFAGLDAESFLDRYVGKPFKPRHIVAGYDFSFGKGREGTIAGIQDWAQRQRPVPNVTVVDAFKTAGEIVSSRRVRDLITNGKVREAALLLGRPFYLRGIVISGAGRGATQVGFATLNQKVENETLPKHGVYATRTKIGSGKSLPSVTNIGVNPTFLKAGDGSPIKVETHVLSGEVQARGQKIDVEFIEYIRPEMQFSSVEDLKKQIQNDILKAKAILEIP